MMEQMNITGFPPPPEKERSSKKERLFLDAIEDELNAAIEERGGSGLLLKIDSTADYTYAKLESFTIFRLHLRGKKYWIKVPIVFADIIPEDYPQETVKSDENNYIRVIIDRERSMESYKSFLVRLAAETVDHYPKEWSCCSRYMQCSSAKKCVHPNKRISLRCGYRKILNSGQIFFGPDRNI